MEMTIIFCLFLAWFLGGFINNLGGMGAAIVTLPILTYFLPANTVVAINCVCGSAIACFLGFYYIKYCNFKSVLWLLTGSIPGCVIGYHILLFVSDVILQCCIGIFLILYALYLLRKNFGTGQGDSAVRAVVAGLFSGVFNITTSIGGPPLASYALYSGWNRKITVGTLNFFYVILSVFTIAGQMKAGMYGEYMAEYCAASLAGLFLGILLSCPFVRYVNQVLFQKILIALIGSSGLMCLITLVID